MQSKRAIFALHRGVNDGQGSSGGAQLRKVAESGFQSLHQIRKNLVFQFTKEVIGESDYWLNQRSISPGLQEYIEAVSYAQYLSTGQLITYKEMLRWLSDDDGTLVYTLLIDRASSDRVCSGSTYRFQISFLGYQISRGS